MRKNVIIAIDGPSGVGKSTVSRLLARELGFTYIDTGAIYRAVALKASDAGIDPDDNERVKSFCSALEIAIENGSISVDGEDLTERIRHPSTGLIASRFSASRGVRETLLHLQRRLAEGECIVMEGRDIGTVVFPSADIKFYIDASSDVRAERRWRELRDKGVEVEYEAIKEEIGERDHRDANRNHAPLRRADDAIYVDTGSINVDEVLHLLLEDIKKRIAYGDTDC
ncbi:MAG: (d)CMP kinase [Thermodesulfobacteriota bacterium]